MISKLKFRFTPVVLFLWAAGATAAPTTWNGTVASKFEAGDGSSKSPYIIKTAEQFALMATHYDDTLHFVLADDIVLNTGSASDWSQTPPKNQWTVYGDTTKKAILFLDGQRHTVSGLYVNSDKDYQGLFGVLGGSIKNLNILNSYIKGGNYVGTVAGALNNNYSTKDKQVSILHTDTLNNISTNAIVSGKNYVGGVVGITGTHAEFDMIFGPDMSNTRSFHFQDIFTTGSVLGNDYVGGIVGLTANSYNHGHFHGLVNNANVAGNSFVGGIAGLRYNDVATHIGMNLCANSGNITGNDFVSGLTLYFTSRESSDDTSRIENIYNTGNITSQGTALGLLIPFKNKKNDYTVYNAYNAGTIKGDSDPIFTVGYKDSVLNSHHIYNFAKDHKDSLREYADSMGMYFMPDTGKTLFNNGFPILAYFHQDKVFEGGSGTKDDPYQINTLEGLRRFEHHAGVKFDSIAHPFIYFKQTSDIELPEGTNNWIPVIAERISYDGAGHSISNISIKTPDKDSIGFFGFLHGSRINNLSLKNVNIQGGSDVGGFIGKGFLNTLTHLSVNGLVSGTSHVCGVAGNALDNMFNITNYANVSGESYVCGISNGASIYLSRNYGNISGDHDVGGISGDFSADLQFSYNRGNVSGKSNVSGILPASGFSADVYNCYSAGTVSGKDGGTIFDSEANETDIDFSALQSNVALDLLGPVFVADAQNENDGYPIFGIRGSGSEEDPYLIQSAADLAALSELSNNYYISSYQYIFSSYFKVTADIKMSGTWKPLFTSSTNIFSGVFDGNGHTISGLKTDSSTTTQAGLFAFNAGTIKNVKIAGSDIRGGNAGAIVGTNYGFIEGCGNEGSTIRGQYAGGIAGSHTTSQDILRKSNGINEDYSISYIIKSYNSGNVFGSHYAGGIAGIMRTDPWATLNNDARDVVSIVNAYNVGNVSTDKGIVAGITNGFSWTHYDAIAYTLKNIYNTVDVCELSPNAELCSPTVTPDDEDENLLTKIDSANIYYLHDGGDIEGVYGFSRDKDTMKSTAFATLLGDAFAYDTDFTNSGYPILSGSGTFSPQQPTEIPGVPLVFRNLQVSVSNREIHLDQVVPGSKTVLFDLRGKRIWSGTASGNSLTIPSQKPGLYIVKNKYQTARIRIR